MGTFRKKKFRGVRLSGGAEKLLFFFLIVVDALALNAVFIEAFRFWLGDTQQIGIYLNSYLQVRLWLFGFYIFFGMIIGIFDVRNFKAASDILSHTANALLASFIGFNLLAFFWRSMAYQTHTFPRPIFLLATAISIVVAFLVRVIIASLFKPYPLLKKAIIIGDESEGKRILKHFHRRGGIRFKIVKTLASDEVDVLASEVIYHNAHEIFVTDPHINLDEFWTKIFYGRKVEPHEFNVRIVYDPKLATGSMGLQSLEDFPLTTVKSLPLSKLQRFVKRSFDICFSLFAIIISSPAMILAAIMVKIDSPGPLFYFQKRVGRFGKEFDVIKFRSMRVGSEAGVGPKVATSDDPRISRVGKFLRKFGIDELPQFFLVLTGEMSVVGPRPERPFFVNEYHEFQGRRLSMKPGVTGLAAVNARYYLRLIDKVGYDYYYLDNYSLIIDIKIIFQTIWVLIFESNKALQDQHHVLDNMKKENTQKKDD